MTKKYIIVDEASNIPEEMWGTLASGDPVELNADTVREAMATLHGVIPVEYDPNAMTRTAEAIAEEIRCKEEHAVRDWLARYNIDLDTLEKNGWHLICSVKVGGDRHYSLARKVSGINLIIHTDVKHNVIY